MSYKILYITLRRLIGERDVAALRSQLLQYGPIMFARSLSLGSPRVVADALSLSQARTAVQSAEASLAQWNHLMGVSTHNWPVATAT